MLSSNDRPARLLCFVNFPKVCASAVERRIVSTGSRGSFHCYYHGDWGIVSVAIESHVWLCNQSRSILDVCSGNCTGMFQSFQQIFGCTIEQSLAFLSRIAGQSCVIHDRIDVLVWERVLVSVLQSRRDRISLCACFDCWVFPSSASTCLQRLRLYVLPSWNCCLPLLWYRQLSTFSTPSDWLHYPTTTSPQSPLSIYPSFQYLYVYPYYLYDVFGANYVAPVTWLRFLLPWSPLYPLPWFRTKK